MKKLLRFSEFLNESLFINEGREQPIQKNGVVVYQASTSKTRVTTKLATELGIEKDAIYQIDLDTISRIDDITRGIPKDKKGANWSNIIKTPKYGYTIKKVGKTAKPGLDVLTINGNPVMPGPDGMIITPSDFKEGGKNTITAANNGILALTRLSRAMNEVLDTSILKGGRIAVGLAKDWSIQILIGGDPESSASRGYKYFYVIPGSFKPTTNTILCSIAVAAIRAYYNDIDGVNLSTIFPDYTKQPKSWWTAKICNATSKTKSRKEIIDIEAQVLNEIMDLLRNFLLRDNYLVSQTPIDISKEWKNFTSNIDSYMTKQANMRERRFVMSLTPAGFKAFLGLLKAIAEKLSDIKMPTDIKMPQSVLDSLISVTSSELAGNSMDINTYIDNAVKDAQRLNDYGPSSELVSITGKSSVNQGEGGY
jgi:hypothetical protein